MEWRYGRWETQLQLMKETVPDYLSPMCPPRHPGCHCGFHLMYVLTIDHPSWSLQASTCSALLPTSNLWQLKQLWALDIQMLSTAQPFAELVSSTHSQVLLHSLPPMSIPWPLAMSCCQHFGKWEEDYRLMYPRFNCVIIWWTLID